MTQLTWGSGSVLYLETEGGLLGKCSRYLGA